MLILHTDHILTPPESSSQTNQVFLVRERHSGKIYAMKVLNKSNIIKRNQVRALRCLACICICG